MTMVETKLYVAYGSNMNRAQMHQRCPGAVPVGKSVINDARLVFRRVADAIREPGNKMPVVIWRINAVHEAALDRFEGVSSGFYAKQWMTLDTGEQALIYVMNDRGIAPPTKEYYATIKQGYADFGIKTESLERALAAAWTSKNISDAIEDRDNRRNRVVYVPAQYGGQLNSKATSKASKSYSKGDAKPKERETLENTLRYSELPRKRSKKEKVTNLNDWLEDRKKSGRGY